MTVMRIEEALPEFYRKFLPDFFNNTIPVENIATCHDCPMLLETGEEGLKEDYFSPASKCCTHYPNLPNYIVGGLLNSKAKDLKEGRQRIRDKIESRIGVTPHGILRPQKYHFLLTHTQLDYFGRSEWLICPYYDREKGICTIRPFWNSVCNTWFCKYTAGYDGRAFWLTLKKYMKSVEEALTYYTLFKMGRDPRDIILSDSSNTLLKVEELDDKPLNHKAYRSLWGDWVGREEDFYQETYSIVQAMTRDDFDHITGINQTVMLEDLKVKHKILSTTKPPEILKRNPELQIKKMDENSCFLIGYSPRDPVEVSRRLYEILDFFDGERSNEEVYRLIRKQDKAVPSEDLLLSLYRLRILVNGEKKL